MRLAIFVGAAALSFGAAGLTGKWKIDGDVQGNTVNLTCSITQDADAKIAGSCVVNDDKSVDIAGMTKDGTVTFSFTSGEYTLNYTGKLDGDSMKGDIEVAGTSGTFSGKREAPAQ